jgi:L-rhamnose-H+ transport protein
MGWGIGSVLFGLAIRLVGFSVAYTIIIGGIAAFGALIPFLIVGNASLFSSKGLPILLALIATVTGISLCAWATKLKEKRLKPVNDQAGKKNKFGFGIAVCVAAAILSSMLNLAFHFGRPIADKAVQLTGFSKSPFIINHTVWVVALSAGFIPFFVYCSYLMAKNKSAWNFLKAKKANWGYSSLMALLWFCCIVLYGLGSEKLGSGGTSTGWLILMSVTVIVGNLWGLISGEWRETSGKEGKVMIAGVFFLLANIVIVGIA